MTGGTTTLRSVLAVLLAAAVVAGPAVAAPTSTATAGSIATASDDPGATTTHTATVTVGEASAGSWTGFSVNYTGTDAQLGEVGAADVSTIGIDRGDDADGATIDVNVSNDLSSVSSAKDGRLLKVGLGGNYALEPGDEVVVVYEDAQNPSTAGAYEVELDVNYQSSGGTATATLDVGATDGTDGTTDDGSGDGTDGTTDDGSGDGTDDDASDGDGSDGSDGDGSDGDGSNGDGSGPIAGFDVLVAVAALGMVSLALIAGRRLR